MKKVGPDNGKWGVALAIGALPMATMLGAGCHSSSNGNPLIPTPTPRPPLISDSRFYRGAFQGSGPDNYVIRGSFVAAVRDGRITILNDDGIYGDAHGSGQIVGNTASFSIILPALGTALFLDAQFTTNDVSSGTGTWSGQGSDGTRPGQQYYGTWSWS